MRSRLSNFIPHQALHPGWMDVSPSLIKKNHRHGCRIYPYIVNEAAVMRDLLIDGVDGIITNDPALALEVYAEERERLPVITPAI